MTEQVLPPPQPPLWSSVGQLSGHSAAIYALAAGEVPLSLYSADGNGWVVYWADLRRNEGLALAQLPSSVFSLYPLNISRLLAAGTMQGILYGIDLDRKHKLQTLQLGGAVLSLAEWQENLLAACGNGHLYVIKPDTWQILYTLSISGKAIRQIALQPQQTLAALACSDGQIYLLDIDNWTIRQTLSFHTQSVFSICFSPDGQYLLSGGRDAQMAIWQANPTDPFLWTLCHVIPAHLSTINHITYSPRQPYFATASRDKSFKIWHSEQFVLQKVLSPDKPHIAAHRHSVNRLLWLPDSDYLVSGGDDKQLLIGQLSPRPQ